MVALRNQVFMIEPNLEHGFARISSIAWVQRQYGKHQLMSAKAQELAVTTNGIRMHLTEQGEGPLVLLCHGWPELGYSWRHQLPALAEAGYRPLAPGLRGYGHTDAP